MHALARIGWFAIVACSLPCLFEPRMALADIYSYVDENGVLVFTNTYPTGKKNFRRIVHQSASPRLLTYMPAPRKSEWDTHIFLTAAKYQVDPALIKAIIHTESNFNPFAVSHKGAEGLMQLMPDTANMVEVADTFDPYANIEGGVKYLKYLLDKFRDVRLSLAAYNAGEALVAKHKGIPPFPETRAYVRRVMALYEAYRNGRP